MRLNINLASQPYEAARQYRQRMTVLIGVLGLAAIVLVSYIVYQRVNSRTVNRQIAAVQQQIDDLSREEAHARAILNKPANRGIADQSEFLNELFARKAMSWTRIFAEMERIVPANLHVVSMKPDYTKSNDLMLHMVVATDSRDRAVELVRRMEKSNHFRAPQVESETVVANTTQQTGAGGDIQFDIAAVYVPGVQDEEPAEAGDKSAGKANQADAGAAPAKAAAGAAGSKPAASTARPAMRPSVNAAQNLPQVPTRGGRALMASIRETRRKLMPVVVALAVLDLVCVGYLLSPVGRSRQARQRDYYQLRDQLAMKQQEVLPTRGMDQKLMQADKDISAFYDHRLPARYSAISEKLGKIAADSGVNYAGVKYDEKGEALEGLRKLNIEIALSGSYLQEVKFINALERDPMFFLIDGVALGEQQGNVRLQLKLETYLRTGAAGIVKLGTENKKKTIVAVGLMIVAAALMIRWLSGGGEEAAAPSNSAAAKRTAQSARKPAHPLLAQSLDPTLRFDLLKSSEDITYKGAGRDIFHSTPEVADIPKPVTPDVQPQGPPPKPPPPPIDLKFYGLAGPKNGNKRIFLLKGEDIFLAREGDIVDRRYKIVHIGPNSVEVEDVLTNNRQTLPFAG